MTKTFDPSRLFVLRKPPPSLAYSVWMALDAIRARKQRIATFVTSIKELRDPESIVFPIMDVAFDRELVVVLFEIEPDVHVFIGRAEELWRVPALLAARETGMVDGRWSLRAEMRVGRLLGISTAACERRLASLTRSGTPETLAYALLDRVELARLRAYGWRSFGTPDEAAGLTLFRQDGVLSRRASKRVPDGFVLARVSLHPEARTKLFGRRASIRLTRRQVPVLHAGMTDRVEVLGGRGWR